MVLRLGLAFAAILVFGMQMTAAQEYAVHTIAGHVPTDSDTTAGEAVLVSPGSSAMDTKGNIYFLDSSPGRVRMLTPEGRILTIGGAFGDDVTVGPEGNVYIAAGPYVMLVHPDGSPTIFAGGSGASGNPATQLRIGQIGGIAADELGTVYLSDTGNHVLRRVLPDGTITSVYTPTLTAPGRIVCGRNGRIYFVDGYQIRSLAGTVLAGNGNYGPPQPGPDATKSPLGMISDLAVNSKGEVFLADAYNRLVLRVDTEGRLDIVLDGGKSACGKYGMLAGLEFDTRDRLIIVDSGRASILRLEEDGTLVTLAGANRPVTDGGRALEAVLRRPVGLAIDSGGSVVLSDGIGNRIYRVTPDGVIHTVAGTGECGSTGDGGDALLARLESPSLLAIDRTGDLLFVEAGTRIRRIRGGTIDTVAGGAEAVYTGDGGSAVASRFVAISDIKADSEGNIYVADAGARRVRKITLDGTIATIAGTGESSSDHVTRGIATQTAICPRRMTIDSDGFLVIYDSFRPADELIRLGPDGMITPLYWSRDPVYYNGRSYCVPQAITALAADKMGILATNGSQVCRREANGASELVGGSMPGSNGEHIAARDASFSNILDLAVDRHGVIVLTDSTNLRVRALVPSLDRRHPGR